MRGGLAIASLVALAACGSGVSQPTGAPVALSEFARQQAETVARDMLAGTYNDADAGPAASCARNLASDAEILALLEAPRDQARQVFEALYAKPSMRMCIEQTNVTWRPFA